jgi:hypothetical protein
MSEFAKKVLPLALTAALGGAGTANAYDGGGVQLGPATRETYTEHGHIEQYRAYVDDVLRYLESITMRETSRYAQNGDLIKDDYTLYRVTWYDALGKRTDHAAECRLVRHVNLKLVPIADCSLPPSEAKEKVPQPVFSFRDPDGGNFVPARGVTGAA